MHDEARGDARVRAARRHPLRRPGVGARRGEPAGRPAVFELGVPVLGICYGLQLMAHELGGQVDKAAHREYGRATIETRDGAELFEGLPRAKRDVWMSHGDRVEALPPGFEPIATTPVGAVRRGRGPAPPLLRRPVPPRGGPHAARQGRARELRLPTSAAARATGRCGPSPEIAVEQIRAQVKDGRVICALSGGVDSAVAALLVHRAIGDRLRCIFVDNGVLRAGERAQVEEVFGADVPPAARDGRRVRALPREARRRHRPRAEAEDHRPRVHRGLRGAGRGLAAHGERAEFLVQGTLYPDVIESVSFKGPSATIKSHHNVGGLPERMKLGLVEPLRELFKDEVRGLGRELGLPAHDRPAPAVPRPRPRGPRPRRGHARSGSSCCARPTRSSRRRSARPGSTTTLWQAFAVLLPVRSVGVMGDERTYESDLRHPRGRVDRRHDRRLGAPAVRPARARSRPASSTRSAASTASSTTSRRSRRRRSSGSSTSERVPFVLSSSKDERRVAGRVRARMPPM